MRAYSTRTLLMGHEMMLTHCPREYLALVDLESYPAFVAKETDHLDMMAHLFAQMKALTAVAWGAPGQELRILFHLTEDDRVVQRMTSAHGCTFASGHLRTAGQVCFTSHDRLFDCARHLSHHILREERLPQNTRPHVLAVPPGVYSVQIFYHLPFPYGGGTEARPVPDPKVHFTVILRHYAFPAPRVAPVRLPGLMPCAA